MRPNHPLGDRAGSTKSRGGSRVPILCYHDVSEDAESRDEWCVTPGALRAQVRLLQRLGYRSLTVSELVDRFDAGRAISRAVVFTFDDGYRDTVTVAQPILESAGFKATVFVMPDLVGKERWGPSQVPLASWEQLRGVTRLGWEVGLHSATHANLQTLPPEALIHEIVDARAELERRLGVSVQSLAYPWGRYTPGVALVVRQAGFRSALTVSRSKAGPSSDRWALPRCGVRRNDSLVEFFLMAGTGYSLGMVKRVWARQWGRLLGYRN